MSHESKIKVSSVLSSFLEAANISWIDHDFLSLTPPSVRQAVLTHLVTLTLTFLLLASMFKYPCDYSGRTWIIWATLSD